MPIPFQSSIIAGQLSTYRMQEQPLIPPNSFWLPAPRNNLMTMSSKVEAESSRIVETHCNSATLIHTGGGELGATKAMFEASNCVRVVTRCNGPC